METIVICLLVLAIALLIYAISQGKKEKNNVLHNEGPIAGLPNIIGAPKDNPGQSSLSTIAKHKRENNVDASDDFDNRNEGVPQISDIPQKGPDEANALLDLIDEEEEMGRYAAYGTEDGFATGITFDELATVGKILARQALEPSEEKTAADIVYRIDGTELLGLLESKIGDTSKKIALLLDRGIAGQPAEGSSLLRNYDDNFDISDHI